MRLGGGSGIRIVPFLPSNLDVSYALPTFVPTTLEAPVKTPRTRVGAGSAWELQSSQLKALGTDARQVNAQRTRPILQMNVPVAREI